MKQFQPVGSLNLEGSYMRASTVIGAIVLVSIIMNEAISACRIFQVEGSYMRVYTVLIATYLVFDVALQEVPW